MSTLKVGALQGISASSDAITLANDGTCTANITNNLSNRNLIINGGMTIAQRSSGPVAVTNNSNEAYQSLDRVDFSFGNNAAGAANISQSTDAPTTLGFTKSHKTDVTTANTTSTGNGIIGLKYVIEGQDIRNSGWNHLSDSSFLTLSFYFKTTKTGTTKLPIMFRTLHGTNYYYVKNITVSDPTNWNRYTCTITGNSNLQIDDANTGGLAIFFSYYTGSDKDTSSEGSWGSTNAYSTSESTNYFDNTSNDMFITGIQLEVSSFSTDFEHRSFGQELALCQRYCVVDVTSRNWYNASGGNVYDYQLISWPTTMRATPTITFGSNVEMTNVNTSGGVNGHGSAYVSTSGWNYSPLSNATGNTTGRVNYTASAEI